MKAEAFVIHLKRARERAPQVARLQAGLPMPVTIVDAVDSKRLSERTAARVYRRELHRPHYPFPLRKAEIACFLSHRKAWQAILDRGLDAGLVIEDDVELGPSFGEVLDVALANMSSRDLVRFPKNIRGDRGVRVAGQGDAQLIAPRHPGLGMQAQLVGREAAAALLAFTERFDRPVDTTVQMCWLHDVRVLVATPVCISEIAGSLGGTTVQAGTKPLGDFLWREVHRAYYRATAKARNMSNIATGARGGG